MERNKVEAIPTNMRTNPIRRVVKSVPVSTISPVSGSQSLDSGRTKVNRIRVNPMNAIHAVWLINVKTTALLPDNVLTPDRFSSLRIMKKQMVGTRRPTNRKKEKPSNPVTAAGKTENNNCSITRLSNHAC